MPETKSIAPTVFTSYFPIEVYANETSPCTFALPYYHYNLYKHSFVLLCNFDGHVNCLCFT